MKVHAQTLFLAVATSALLVAAGPMVMGGKAQAADMPVKAPSATEAIANAWWFHGYVEAGGRFFANDPEKSGIASRGGRSLGKFYEYRDLRPGPFGNFHLATGTNDGLYQVDVWGHNVGYDDQRYDLSASKAGEMYFNFQWDETPHNYGTGHTIFNGAGTTALTLPGGLSNQLHNDCAAAPGCTGATQNAAVKRDVENNLHDVDMGIQRDTASVDWRWTPTTAWDVRADYSNTHRTGTQTDGVTLSWGTSGVRVDAPKPVDDTTQNFGVNGEFQGTSPWGKLFTFKVAYTGSVYTDHDSSYTIQNPFCATGATTCDSTSAPMGMMSLWPSNNANGVSATLGADLPAKSRYMGTASYVMMRQNENFLPFTINPNLGNDPVNGQPWTSTAALPASSLNGEINTFLSNNVLTTKLTSDLESKLSYRYYNFDNQTPEILVPMWIGADINQATPLPTSVSPSNSAYRNVQSISISYTKQNAGAQLNWRPDKHWNLGAAYGYERYDWTRADADATNENSGKVFADWKPIIWATARASWEFGARRYNNYDYLGNVATAQWQNGGSSRYSTAYRQFYLDNRDRNKARVSLAMDLFHNFTVTPSFGLLNDEYKLNQTTEVGLLHSHAWNAGVDVAYNMTPATRFMFSYLYEHRSQLVSSAGTAVPPFSASSYYTADVEDKVNTFVFAVDHALIPDKLDLHLGYTTALATNSQPLYFANGSTPTALSGGQYPDVKSTFQRLEAIAKYTFDQDVVRSLGWKGKVFAKLGYAWERNAVDNWQIDNISPYMGGSPFCPNTAGTSFGCGFMLWLANDNPNYNVHMIKASLGFKW